MNKRWAGVFLPLLLACTEPTQPTPELDALQKFLAEKTDKVDACLRAGVLVTEAHELLQSNPSELVVVQQLVKKYEKPSMTADERDRLAKIMTGQTLFASELQQLSKESVGIAYLQTCRYQSGGGKVDFTQPDWPIRLMAAGSCEKEMPAGTKRKECLAKAFVRSS